MAKQFFYVCVGLFLLAAAYHLGASTATAQAGASTAVGISGFGTPEAYRYVAVAADGNVYTYSSNNAGWWFPSGNIFGATPTVETSWGALKGKGR